MPNLEPLEILYHALSEPIGLLLRVDDFDLARRRLYEARTNSRDRDLWKLAILQTSPELTKEGNLIIAKADKTAKGGRNPF